MLAIKYDKKLETFKLWCYHNMQTVNWTGRETDQVITFLKTLGQSDNYWKKIQAYSDDQYD